MNEMWMDVIRITCLAGFPLFMIYRFTKTNRDISNKRTFYGMTSDEYYALKHSEQTRVRNEWLMDNNKEDINYVYNSTKLLKEEKASIDEAELIKLKAEDLDDKYDCILAKSLGWKASEYIIRKRALAKKEKANE